MPRVLPIRRVQALGALVALGLALVLRGEPVRVLKQNHDPYGFPRPGAGQTHVPLRTSFYLELGADAKSKDTVLIDSVSLRLQAAGGEETEILSGGRKFAPGYTGTLSARTSGMKQEPVLTIYVSPEIPLKPYTQYTVRVQARSSKGGEIPRKEGTWSFTTESEPVPGTREMQLNLADPPVRWQGAFFSGFCKPSFCTSDPTLMSTYELMAEARREFTRAWSLQRDFWLTGMDDKPGFLRPMLANVVRERETRRITAVEEAGDAVRLKVEDFFGHSQYGIPSGRALSEDYHPDDTVLIADNEHSARTRVIGVDDEARTVLVRQFPMPAGGWQTQYAAPLPAKEEPGAPGLFALGGCYLRKFSPAGTPAYYWGRVDKEWDIAFRKFGRRLMPNFADAPGDLSVDGRNWTTAKDYAQLHEVVRVMTDRIIQRYQEASLTFVWSIFNEPDLGALFWRSDWNELQKYYDYATDAILRAFEDRGYDSRKVFIGGLELGGIFGVHLKTTEFLTHCSPRAQGKGALPENAAFADKRLDGKRSRRVEELCAAHNGQGAPCDFISVHAYNRSEVMAAKLIKAKETALAIDADYYADLWVNSHESCPSWSPPADPAAADSFRGNGYYPTWCADVVRRQLQQAHRDPRYAFGETILTLWPFPTQNFEGLNNVTRLINADRNGDGATDDKVLVAKPIFHFLGLLSSMGPEYWVLPEQLHGGTVIAGFASRGRGDVRLVLYTHNAADTQSRSEERFDVMLELGGMEWPDVRVQEYRFDREHNSYFRAAQQLRERPPSEPAGSEQRLAEALRGLDSSDREARLEALKELGRLGVAARGAGARLLELAGETDDNELRDAANAAVWKIIGAQTSYRMEDVEKVRELSRLRVTSSRLHSVQDGRLRLSLQLTGNGLSFIVIQRSSDPSGR